MLTNARRLLVGLVLVAAAAIGFLPAAQAQSEPGAAAAAQGGGAAVDPAAPASDTTPRPAAEAPTENPYGIEALWRGSDLVAKCVLVMMVVMSMGSWYVIAVKLIEQARIGAQAKATAAFWEAQSVRQGADSLDAASPFRLIAERGLDAARRHEGLRAHVDLNTWVTMGIQRAVERVQARLQSGLAFLATVGSTAPFVGLFGTVWGIYHALTAIGVAGQASIDRVAGPVGEALIMTAIGLAVAVPAVLGYNWLVRRNKACMEGVRAFGNELHPVLLADAGRTA